MSTGIYLCPVDPPCLQGAGVPTEGAEETVTDPKQSQQLARPSGHIPLDCAAEYNDYDVFFVYFGHLQCSIDYVLSVVEHATHHSSSLLV